MPFVVPWADPLWRSYGKREQEMSWKSREKKRQTKRRTSAVAGKAKLNRTPETAKRWFRIDVRKPARCAQCDVPLRKKAEAIYRREPREIRCVGCGERMEDSKNWKPSAAWEMRRRDEFRRRNEKSKARWAKHSDLEVAGPGDV
jgi:hypothetical protein